jgi:hypothetical protein
VAFGASQASREEQVWIVVENSIWNDVVIYAQTFAHRTRLGTVTTGQRERFKLPVHQRLSPDLQLVADPIGSARLIASGPIVAVPGQVVSWTVSENAAARTATVR